MAKVMESRNYPGKSPDDCFDAAKVALPKAGFEIWKLRPIAWLVLANRQTPEGVAKANLAFRPGAAGTLTLTGDRLSQETLQAMAAEAMVALDAELG
jgi:hypothetical protein